LANYRSSRDGVSFARYSHRGRAALYATAVARLTLRTWRGCVHEQRLASAYIAAVRCQLATQQRAAPTFPAVACSSPRATWTSCSLPNILVQTLWVACRMFSTVAGLGS